MANDGWEEDKDQGPHLHEQDFGRTIKDEGSMKHILTFFLHIKPSGLSERKKENR